jgi:hypothetical protein
LVRDHRCRELTDIDGRANGDFTSVKYGLIALSAAFSISMVMSPLGNTAGWIGSLKRFARTSGGVKEPLAPTGMSFINYPLT